MKDDELIISGFDSDKDSEGLLRIDFKTAKQLRSQGSTCDAYECILQRRRVFVKRLKPEFRDNPFYLAAFDKEYDLGVSLSHPSLPHYVGLGGDYIVMDFIEGDTLADLIKRHDSRLNDKRFCLKIISELIDVAEYLHYRNIVHCDIKADNILIPPYADRPVKLIDFDKAYTTWLDSTKGNPAKYDCDDCADGRIDLCGIGKVAGMLGQKRVAAACQKNDATISDLRKILNGKHDRIRVRKWAMALCVMSLCVTGLLKIGSRENTISQPADPVAASSDTVATESRIESGAAPVEPKSVAVESVPVIEKPALKTQKETATTADTSEDKSVELDEIISRYYGPLSRRHEYLRELAASPEATAEQLRMVIASYVSDQSEAQNRIISDVATLYGLSDPVEAVTILARSDAWNLFMKQDAEINRLYCR